MVGFITYVFVKRRVRMEAGIKSHWDTVKGLLANQDTHT